MMEQKKEIKVGDKVYLGHLVRAEYNECEFKKTKVSGMFEITKVPDPKPEVPDEPRTRGSVVTIEGDDEFIAVRFTDTDDLPYPFVASYSCIGDNGLFGWDGIVFRAAGRKIIVHKMVDPNGVPNRVDTYSEWLTLPKDGLSKYKWMDTDGDLWIINDQSGKFEFDGVDDQLFTLGEEYFPLTLDDKIG